MTIAPSYDVCMLVRNSFEHDGRVEREAQYLRERGKTVLIVAEGRPHLPRFERRWYADVVRVASRGRYLRGRLEQLRFTLYYNAAAACVVRASGAPIIHCHDLNTLATGALMARLRGCRLIYDAHELWPESIADRGELTKAVQRVKYSVLEASLIGRADAVITVCDAIADEMARRYAVERPLVLRNLPIHGAGNVSLRGHLGVSAPIALYLGQLSVNRGLEQLIEAMALLPGVALVLMGPSSEETCRHLRGVASANNVDGRLHILPPVPREQIIAWSRDAAVGLCVYRAVCLNHVLAMPNKLFEYLHAEVPVVVSDFPEMGRFVRDNRVGAVCNPESPADIARAINLVLTRKVPLLSTEEWTALLASHTWTAERSKLDAIYPT